MVKVVFAGSREVSGKFCAPHFTMAGHRACHPAAARLRGE
jgi:hypothetical protein